MSFPLNYASTIDFQMPIGCLHQSNLLKFLSKVRGKTGSLDFPQITDIYHPMTLASNFYSMSDPSSGHNLLRLKKESRYTLFFKFFY